MTPENWKKLKPILEMALTLSVEERREFLENECENAAMLREAEAFLEFLPLVWNIPSRLARGRAWTLESNDSVERNLGSSYLMLTR